MIIVRVLILRFPSFRSQVGVKPLRSLDPVFVVGLRPQVLPQPLPLSPPGEQALVSPDVDSREQVQDTEGEYPTQDYQEKWPLEDRVDESFSRFVPAAPGLPPPAPLVLPPHSLLHGPPVVEGGDETGVGCVESLCESVQILARHELGSEVWENVGVAGIVIVRGWSVRPAIGVGHGSGAEVNSCEQ